MNPTNPIPRCPRCGTPVDGTNRGELVEVTDTGALECLHTRMRCITQRLRNREEPEHGADDEPPTDAELDRACAAVSAGRWADEPDRGGAAMAGGVARAPARRADPRRDRPTHTAPALHHRERAGAAEARYDLIAEVCENRTDTEEVRL